MDTLRIIVVGPGRAGMSLAMAAAAAGHEIVAVVGKTGEHAAEAAGRVGTTSLGIGEGLPEADLLVVATRDDAIAPVAARIAATPPRAAAAVHLSGLTSVEALEPLSHAGLLVGSFHPLQTLPTPELGSVRLAGAAIAVTADEPLRSLLRGLAESIGAHPFDLDDAAKGLYHAAAAAAANFPIVAMAMAADLFEAAGVPFEAARPLVEAIVANTFELGPRAALTGPVARGDVATVDAQLAAVNRAAPEWRAGFVALAAELARLTGRREQFDDVLVRWGESS